MHIHRSAMMGLAGTWDWAAHALQVQSISQEALRTGPLTCGLEDSYLFDIPDQVVQCVWGPMSLKMIKNNQTVLLVRGSGWRGRREQGAGRKGSDWWRAARGARPCSSCSVVSVTLKPRLAGFRITCSLGKCIWSCRLKLCQGDYQLIDTWCGKSQFPAGQSRGFDTLP